MTKKRGMDTEGTSPFKRLITNGERMEAIGEKGKMRTL